MTKPSVFVKCNCAECDNTVGYFEVHEGDDAFTIPVFLLCESCYDEKQKKLEGMK